jgi:hypothetical protein
MMGNRIYNKVKDNERIFCENEESADIKDVEGQQRHQGRQDWLRDLIDIILYQELYRRRSENRRMRQKFY